MKRPALAHLLGYTALTLVLTAGAAQSLAGSNTVTSDDIVDGTIVANDIKTAAIGGRPIVDNSITGADVNEATLTLPGVIRTTGVSPTGTKVFGAGTPTKVGTGHYTVDYGVPLKNCSAHVTGGCNAANGLTDYSFTAWATIFPAYSSANSVDVYFRNGANTGVDSSFFLTVICAAGSAGHTTAAQTNGAPADTAPSGEEPPQR